MKTKELLILVMVLLSLFSCSKDKTAIQKDTAKQDKTTAITTIDTNSKGYKLMEQKCFICHKATANPANMGSMLAPPMQKVQEHYKPMYASKDAFVKAISQWVQNPDAEKTLMPGAVRKFKVMPKMAFEDADIKLIAETIYAIDFGKSKAMSHKGLQLNAGKKWKLNKNTLTQIKEITTKLSTFNSTDLKAYNSLGAEVLNSAKEIILDDAYKGPVFEQLHTFFNSIEGNMHQLIGAKNIETAKQQQDALKAKFSKLNNFFE